VNWMLDIHDKNPEYFKNELKKQKGKPRKDSIKTTLSNLNSMKVGSRSGSQTGVSWPHTIRQLAYAYATEAGGCGGCIPQCELKTVQVKFAEKPKPPVKVDNQGFIKVDFS